MSRSVARGPRGQNKSQWEAASFGTSMRKKTGPHSLSVSCAPEPGLVSGAAASDQRSSR